MNGWFPKLRADGVIASGNAGIWVTPLTGPPVQVSPVGTSPVWAGQTLIFNRNDNTTHVGRDVLPSAYNEYVGSDSGQWAGFSAAVSGHVDRYCVLAGFYKHGAQALESVPLACLPQFYGASFGYVTPYQSVDRALIIETVVKASGKITTWASDRTGQGYIYAVAIGTYTKRLFDQEGNDITIRSQQDESPLAVFVAPDGLLWMLSVTPESGTFVRHIYSAAGYVIAGDLYNPDCRVLGDRLRVVGSSNAGVLRGEWIDFGATMVDLRNV